MKNLYLILFLALTIGVRAQGKVAETKKAIPAPVKTTVTTDGHNHEGHSHDAPVQQGGGEEKKTTPANPNAPKIAFKEETYEFGELPEGPQATHEFKFTNMGKEPLVLSNVRASCGCTTPSWPKEPILPGKEGVILVTYNTQGRVGPFTKSVTINSNATEADKVIYIKGEVIKADPEKSVPVEQPTLLSPKNK